MPFRRVTLLFILLLIPLLYPKPASAQCAPSCTNGYWCSYSSCCKCVYGDQGGAYGPVECCNPPGNPPGNGCSTYDVYGCRPGTPHATNTPPPPTATSVPPATIPPPAPTIPIDEWAPLKYPCNQVTEPEFHPLRPYPGSPCDPLIPRKVPEAPASTNPDKMYLTYMCAKSTNVYGEVTKPDVFDICGDSFIPSPIPTPYIDFPGIRSNQMESPIYRCEPTSTDLCFLKRVLWNIEYDLSSAQLPIMGNTQMLFGDAQKVNHYLTWYLNGTILQSLQEPLDLNDPADINRITTYSGPLNKLLPKDIQTNLRDTLKQYGPTTDTHNYIINIPDNTRLNVAPTPLYKNIAYSTLEDTTSEFTVSLIPGNQPVSPEINGSILSIGLYIDYPSDSRLYFPHMRASLALSEILNSLSKPILTPTPALDSTDPQLVRQRITQHQGQPGVVPGGSDNTIVEIAREYPNSNQITRNTEVREGAPAPTPLYDSDKYCDLINTRSNQGDSLKPGLNPPTPGATNKSINATLEYYQLFHYTPREVIQCEGVPCPPTNPGGLCVNKPCQWFDQECNITDKLCCTDELKGGYGGTEGNCPFLSDCQHADANLYCLPPQQAYECRVDPINGVYLQQYPYSCATRGDMRVGWVCCGPADRMCRGDDAPDGPIDYFCRTACNSDALCGQYPPAGCLTCHWETNYTLTPNPPYCPIWPTVNLPSAARTNNFSKTPLIEKIYDILIVSPQSVLRRWLPQKPENITDEQFLARGRDYTVPGYSPVRYAGDTVPVGSLINTRVTGGKGGSGGMYFPLLGSLQNYFLGSAVGDRNLQCLLRPFGMCRATPLLSSCDGTRFSEIAPAPTMPSNQAITNFQTFIVPHLTTDVVSAYQAAEDALADEGYNVPCEVLAGIHYIEGDNDPTRNLQNGGPLSGTLTDSAIAAAHELLAHACNTYTGAPCPITDLNTLIKALSYYNGGGNANCQSSNNCAPSHGFPDRCGSTVSCATNISGCVCSVPFTNYESGSCRQICRDASGGEPYPFPYQIPYNFCPPMTIGYDDIYVTNWWISPEHDNMYLLHKYDCTQTLPELFLRPGSLTVAIMLYMSETGNL